MNGDGKIVVGYIAKNLTDPFHAPINATAQEVIDGLDKQVRDLIQKRDAALLAAQQEAERKKIAAEAEASVKKINADAEAYSIQAKANAESEANKKISESLTDKLVDYTQAKKWNGELPKTYVGSDQAMPIIQAGETEQKSVG